MTATNPTALVAFLNEAARYFERRDTNGEDSAFWANAVNADNCRKAAAMIAEQVAETARLESQIAKNAEELAEAKANLNASRNLVELRTKQRDDEAKRADGNWECIREEQAATSALRRDLAQIRDDGGEKLAFGRRLRRVLHRNRQSTYRVLGEARIQISVPGPDHGVVKARTIVEGDSLTVYWADIDNTFHLRFPDEFEDGRFEDLKHPVAGSCTP